MQSLYLPKQIACRLIQLQVTIQDGGLSRQSIIDLIECYTRAVEFYNEKGDDRRLHYYQHKLQDFLQQPAISQVLQKGTKSDLTLRREKNEESVRKMGNQTQELARRLIEDSNKQELAIQQNIAKQEQSLQERIERKRASSHRLGRNKFSHSMSSSHEEDPIGILQLPSPPPKGH